MSNVLGIKKHADAVTAALDELGRGWHSRAEIAKYISNGNRTRLYDYELAALEMLIVVGSAEGRKMEIPGPIPLRWEYRIKSKDV